MSTPAEPLRLLLLADEPQWAARLRECLQPLTGSAVVLSAPSWEAVDHLFGRDHQTLVLATPALQPAPGRCGLPLVLLLEEEPELPPPGVSDWLVLTQLTTDTLRRCLRHVRERGVLEAALQHLVEQDGRGMLPGHLDLDNFRRANDALGHHAGDRLIELRRALRRDELALHYQPRLSLADGRIVGLEALVRWHHVERGLLPPSEFVPLAEQSGLIVPLGYWVISRALRDMQTLRERGLAPLHMAVNLSFRQFQDSQLLATLSRLIIEHGVDARWLEFELTETAVMRRNDRVQQTMEALDQLGVRFSLDDFGTGFSSFVHLDSLPITLLKIDRNFVAGMDKREENRKLVHAMINLAHNLDLQVVAEGVENAEQLALLKAYGCDQVQGFLISRPLPVDTLVPFLLADAGQQAFVR